MKKTKKNGLLERDKVLGLFGGRFDIHDFCLELELRVNQVMVLVLIVMGCRDLA